MLTATLAMVVGAALAFYYNWLLAIVGFLVFSLGSIGNYLQHRYETTKYQFNAKLLEDAGKVKQAGTSKF